MKKIKLLLLFVAFAVVFSSCNFTTVEQKKETVQENNDVEYIMVNWDGYIEKYEDTEKITGLTSNMIALAWIAPRGGAGIDTEGKQVTAADDEYIAASEDALLSADGDYPQNELEDWVRIVKTSVESEEGTTVIGYKDILIYRQNEDAYIAVQLEEQNKWNVYKLPEYGIWFDKELDIFMRMVTGL